MLRLTPQQPMRQRKTNYSLSSAFSCPYSEYTVHLLICFEWPVCSSKILHPYTAAFGGVYTT